MTGRPKKILFVCTGNTCRSPMAEACAKVWLLEHGFADIEVTSAGIQARPGEPASEFARELCAPHLDNHRSKNLDEELVRSSDIIFGMTERHISFVRRMFGPVVPPTYFLSFTDNIPDPFGKPKLAYQETYNVISTNVALQLAQTFCDEDI